MQAQLPQRQQECPAGLLIHGKEVYIFLQAWMMMKTIASSHLQDVMFPRKNTVNTDHPHQRSSLLDNRTAGEQPGPSLIFHDYNGVEKFDFDR